MRDPRTPRGRKGYDGVTHTWKVPADIEDIYQLYGIQYIWDAVRKYHNMNTMTERFTMADLPDLKWRVTDNHTGVVLTFDEGEFNDYQEVDTKNYKGNPLKIATVLKDLGQWVFDNYPYLVSCDIRSRVRAVQRLSSDDWYLIVSAFNGHMFSAGLSAKEELKSEVEDWITYNTDGSDRTILGKLRDMDEQECREILLLTQAYWERENTSFPDWVEDLYIWSQVANDMEIPNLEVDIHDRCVDSLRAWLKEEWYTRLDIEDGCYLDTIYHYDDRAAELIDQYTALHSDDGGETYDTQATKFFAELEAELKEINEAENV